MASGSSSSPRCPHTDHRMAWSILSRRAVRESARAARVPSSAFSAPALSWRSLVAASALQVPVLFPADRFVVFCRGPHCIMVVSALRSRCFVCFPSARRAVRFPPRRLASRSVAPCRVRGRCPTRPPPRFLFLPAPFSDAMAAFSSSASSRRLSKPLLCIARYRRAMSTSTISRTRTRPCGCRSQVFSNTRPIE